jgi:hypothetical protein
MQRKPASAIMIETLKRRGKFGKRACDFSGARVRF